MKEEIQNLENPGGKKIKSSPDKGKGELTRKKILDAALKVFARNPYKAASMRLIGKEAGVEHPLINYYFSSKADLVKAVLEKICNDISKSNEIWFDGLEKLNPTVGFSLYIDRLLSYSVKYPEPFRIVALNMARIDRVETIPGYKHILDVIKKIVTTFQEKIPMQGTSEEIEMFVSSLNAMMINYLGASSWHAQILGMDPDSNEYIDWVRENLIFVFLPRLRELIFPYTNSKHIKTETT